MKEGVKNKQVKRVEKELVGAIKNHRNVDYKLIGEKILRGVEISSKVVLLIQKFLTIVGYSAG
jgi:hypothetical protein